jgi:hypothetical protein
MVDREQGFTRREYITIWQQNLNKLLIAQLDMLESIKKDYDIILIQEPHIDFRNLTRANSYYTVVYPPRHHDNHRNTPTRSIILVNRKLQSQAWSPIPIQSPDITAVQVTGEFGTIRIFNIYNDCEHNNSIMVLGDYMRSVAARNTTRPPVRYIWAGDYNRHHSLWEKERNFHLFTQSNLDAAQPLLDLIARHRMKMALPEGIPTLKALAMGNLTRVDNVFCSEALLDHVISCVTVPEDRPPKTDHFPIRSVIHATVHRSKFKSRPKYREVDWESF